MTLDEAIKHCEEVADMCEYETSRYDMTDDYESHMACENGECAEKHRQLAEWLKELKQFKEYAIPLDKVKDAREKIQHFIDACDGDTVAGANMRSAFCIALEEVNKLIESEE